MSLHRYARRELRRRPGRTALTLLGIAIGVAAIVAISITIGTTRSAYREMFETLAGRAELEVVAEGAGRFPAAVADALRPLEGVKAVVPTIQSHTALVSPRGVVGVILLGIDPALDRLARDYQFRAGRQVRGRDEVVLPEGLAETFGLNVGDRARLLTPDGTVELAVVGLLGPKGPAAAAGGNVIFVSIDAARAMYALDDVVNTLAVVLITGARAAEVESRIARRLPGGLLVERPAARAQLAQHSLLTTEQGLSAMSAVSLVAGGFVVMNTFLINLSERRRQLAILRAIGATRSQITRLILGEALFVGAIGTGVGAAIGVLLSLGLTAAVSKIIGAPLPPLRLTATPFVLAGCFGPGMAVFSTFVPARRAAAGSILAGLFGGVAGEERRSRRWSAAAGACLLLLNLVLVGVVLSGRLMPARVTAIVGPLTASFLVSCVLLIPMAIPGLNRLVARLLRPFLGLEGRLALRQLDRRPTRTALTVGVLFIAVVMAISMGNSLINNIRDIGRWTERTITSDFLVRSVMPDTGLLTASPIAESIGRNIARMPEAARVSALNFVPVRVSGQRALLLARSQAPGAPLSLDLVEGDEEDVKKRLASGEAVLGTTLAQRLRRHVGDTIALATRRGDRQLRIAGVATEYTVGGMALYLERDFADGLLDLRGVDVFMVTAREGKVAALGRRLAKFCAGERMLLQSQEDFREMVDQMMAGVTGSLWLLMLLVFVVASLGVVNTLSINALEQTREFGVLRAVGMRRGQVRKMVLAEALTMAVVSVIPGCVVGIALARLMNATVYPVMGHPVAFRLEVGFVVICVSLALVVAMAAALLPARRVAGLNVVRALQYE